ncbi:HNH endonuclease [Streptomyces sp. MS19]|uniref:HNH endonuclease n=1 Tax=Streptomyces sp. MS19 TaxID=3385972 RepID=UPI00399FFAA5
MIPLQRPDLPKALDRRLADRTDRLRAAAAGVETSRKAWRSARTIRRDVRSVLDDMAAGFSRCMYCGDSQGTAIDHFLPIADDPLRAFIWANHFLACSHCNSNEKRDQYPCDAAGSCLLVDPCVDDPSAHLRLTLPTGEYTGITRKGRETIRVFGLGRPSLERGRAKAFVRCRSMLRDWLRLMERDAPGEAREVLESLQVQPFADVLHAMVGRADAAGAEVVFGPDVTTALKMIRGDAGPGALPPPAA